MNSDLVKFLRANHEETVWFITPGGLICGELAELDEDSHVFGLLDVTFYSGKTKLELGDSHISADNISAWGLSEPTLPAD